MNCSSVSAHRKLISAIQVALITPFAYAWPSCSSGILGKETACARSTPGESEVRRQSWGWYIRSNQLHPLRNVAQVGKEKTVCRQSSSHVSLTSSLISSRGFAAVILSRQSFSTKNTIRSLVESVRAVWRRARNKSCKWTASYKSASPNGHKSCNTTTGVFTATTVSQYASSPECKIWDRSPPTSCGASNVLLQQCHLAHVV